MTEKPQKILQKFFAKNKKMPLYLLVLAALGALLLLFNRLAAPTPQGPLPQLHYAQAYGPEPVQAVADFSYERTLEQRLEEFFSLVEGAGRVRVMVSPASGRETVFHVDVNESRSYSTMEDAQGGTSESRQQSTNETTVMITDRNGTDIPLIVREIEPRIAGIAIIAEGGANPTVQEALTNAARAILGLDAHMIRVLPMTDD